MLLRPGLLWIPGERILIDGRVAIADLCSLGVGITEPLVRVDLDQLAGMPVLLEQLGIGALRLVSLRVLPELGSRWHLGALGLVQPVEKHVAAAALGILEEGEETLAGQLRSLRRLTVVL